MRHAWSVPDASEDDVRRLAETIALKARAGDVILLSGGLGAGKTTFARFLVRALLGEPDAEVPSPTFSLLQTYAGPRGRIAHADLYRLGHADELDELGIDEAAADGVLIVEWPERAPGLSGDNRLEVTLSQVTGESRRRVEISATGTWAARLERVAAITDFLARNTPWDRATVAYLQGDASARAYARLRGPAERAILMDSPRQPDGPPIRNGLPYSRIAHLAEDVRPFVAVQGALVAAGLSVPSILAADLAQGLLVIEDLGDAVFGRVVAQDPAAQPELWRSATEVLAALHGAPAPEQLPLASGDAVALPAQDRGVLAIETALLPDWYWPLAFGVSIPTEALAEFDALWAGVFDRLARQPAGWVLRDFHSPNLMWLPDRDGLRRVGLLDFQDALRGSPAYDLVSLLQDARLDVPAALEAELLAHYIGLVSRSDAGFDRAEFSFAYAALGAQRNTKILGIFARLAVRDGKRGYLAHIPRIWRYLARDLAHPDLAPLGGWYDRHFPPAARTLVPEAA